VELRQAEAALERWGEDRDLVAVLGEQGAEEFRALFDGFPELVGVLWPIRDDAGRIVDFHFGYGNPAMLRNFRLPAETPKNYTLLEALPQMRGSRAFEVYVRACDEGVPWTKEVTYDTPIGEGYMLGTYVLRVGKLGHGLIVFLTDVTDQRRMEGELRSYADVVAHDLSAPLSNIALLVRQLENRSSEPPSPEVIRLLQESTERARELIEGILVYARVGELERQSVCMADLVAEVTDDLRPTIDEAGARVVFGEMPEVQGDPRQLRRVVQNLIANAIKFRSPEPLVIQIAAERGPDEWVITIRDNGLGVASEDTTRIFGIFSRSEGREDGHGIGLAVCRRVIEAHGGRIWVEAASGGGSAFRFTLPD
jgi:signal transduction histidine kinase